MGPLVEITLIVVDQVADVQVLATGDALEHCCDRRFMS